MLGMVGEKPTPLPIGAVEDVQRRAVEGEFDRRIFGSLDVPPIAAGTHLRVTGGPFESFDGICLASTEQRVRVLLSMFDRKCPADIERRFLEVA